MSKLIRNPFYLLLPPILFIISLPLAGFAVFTTVLAIATLFVRASLVYFDLGLALLHSWIFIEQNASHGEQMSPHHGSKKRHSSSSLGSSTQSLQLSQEAGLDGGGPVRSESYLSLLGVGTPNRDYEGVGGWRNQGDALEEGMWINMNSRLELPAATPGGSGGRRGHRRSLTGASQRYGAPESMRMSPVQSRARTPSFSREEDLGYFDHYHGFARRKSGSSSLAGSNDGKKKNRSQESIEAMSRGNSWLTQKWADR
jgi:hypothetical protein